MKDVATRAITKDPGTVKFTKGTGIFMLMKSEYESLPDGFTHLNYGGTTSDKYTTTLGKVKADGTSVEFVNDASNTRTRYWDDAHARSSHLSIWAVACDGLNELGGSVTALNESSNIFNTANAKTPWSTTAVTATSLEWNVPHFTMSQKGADETSMKNRDLLYSNNVSKYTINSTVTDNRTTFNTSTKKFGNSAMNFYHALTKITVKINMGQGFTGTNDFRFTASGDNINVALQYFNIWGKFDIETGVWTAVNNAHQAIAYMHNLTGNTPNTSDASKPAYQLEALVIPYLNTDSKSIKGSFLSEDDTNKAIVFTIDNNKFEVSRKELLKALRDNSTINGIASNATTVEMEAGKHYIFTFTIGKKQIDNITASIVDWETVESVEQFPSNARIKLNLEERTGDKTDTLTDGEEFSIYRAADDNTGNINDDYAAYNWAKAYSNDGANLTWDTDHWKTSWYWDSNKNFYHFRALCEQTSSAKQTVTSNLSNDVTNGDYYTLNHCEKTSTTSYDDILWGAPMKDVEPANDTDDRTTLKWNYGPTTNGFDGSDNIDFSQDANKDKHQIYKAIGPTEDPIKLILFHMMSDVTFKVKTTAVGQLDRVNLGNGNTEKTTIKLEKIHKEGKLFMGNGLVKGSTADVENSNYTFAPSTSAPDASGFLTWANYGAIPQSLEDVVLVITTPDHNQYKVKLWDADHPITATVTNHNLAIPYKESSTAGKYKIDRWYPGFKYTYTFTLKKTGITNIQATIVDWETVEAGNETVQIQ